MRRYLLFLAVLSAFAFSSTSCAIFDMGSGHEYGSASLSDAAAVANPDSTRRIKQRRPLDVGDTVTPEPSVAVEVAGGASGFDEGAPAGVPGAPRRGVADHGSPPGMFSLVAGGGTIGGAEYDGFGELGVEISAWAAPRWRIDLLGSVSPIQFSDETVQGQSFQDEFDLNLDLAGRYYLTPPHTFLSAYPVAGIRFGTLFWRYAKPVTVLEDGVSKKIDDDHINHFSLYGGMGASLLQIRHAQIGVALLSGVRFYSWGTKHGLSNDLLPTCGFVQVRVEAGYKF